MNLATVASPGYAVAALNLVGSYFRNCAAAARVVFCHFGGLDPIFMSQVGRRYGGRFLFREVPKSCAHAYDPGIWFFKAYALAAGRELGEPFLYLDARAAILREPLEISQRLRGHTRFFVQLPPSPGLFNGRWTSRRCLQKMGCDEDRFRNFAQYMAGLQAYLPTPENWAHVDEMLQLMHDPEIAGPSRVVAKPDGPSGMCEEHRGDQSVLSTLIERNGWHQPFDLELFLKYGDLATARRYAADRVELREQPSVVVAIRQLGTEFVPPDLLEASRAAGLV